MSLLLLDLMTQEEELRSLAYILRKSAYVEVTVNSDYLQALKHDLKAEIYQEVSEKLAYIIAQERGR